MIHEGAAAPFAVRGVIEGFYGNPWTREQRLDLIEFLAAHGMNTFVYAPKDDPLVRRAWRQAYTGDDLQRLTELVERCPAHGVDLVYCLSPGLSIRYSDPGDIEALSAKFSSVAALGVRTVRSAARRHPDRPPAPRRIGPPSPTWPERTFTSSTRSLRDSVPDRALVVCPTVYWGRGDEPYLARLGAGIDPHIDLFWSGRAICSPTLDLDDAERFAATTGRPPLFWDNYPVNDVAMGFELHIGPYRGRDPELWRSGARRDLERHGVVRGLEDPVRDDRGLSRVAGDATTRRPAGGRRSSRSSVRTTWMRSRCSPTTCARRASPPMTHRS